VGAPFDLQIVTNRLDAPNAYCLEDHLEREVSMMHRRPILFCLALTTITWLAVPTARGAEAAPVDDAVQAAQAWLGLVDAGDYAKSWQESARLFKAAVTTEQWNQALAASRKPLGGLLSRKTKTTKYATSLPGAPDGEYVVIQFTSSFVNKKSAIETITPMKDPDGA
jgi:hypothetical protein